MNTVGISGNLTRDPEIRATTSGTTVLNFSVAVNERRKGKSGDWEDYANFFDCVMIGNRADAISRFLSKGMKVAIQGKLHWSHWEKDGQKRSKVEIRVDDIDFIAKYESTVTGIPATPSDSYTDEDIPF